MMMTTPLCVIRPAPPPRLRDPINWNGAVGAVKQHAIQDRVDLLRERRLIYRYAELLLFPLSSALPSFQLGS